MGDLHRPKSAPRTSLYGLNDRLARLIAGPGGEAALGTWRRPSRPELVLTALFALFLPVPYFLLVVFGWIPAIWVLVAAIMELCLLEADALIALPIAAIFLLIDHAAARFALRNMSLRSIGGIVLVLAALSLFPSYWMADAGGGSQWFSVPRAAASIGSYR